MTLAELIRQSFLLRRFQKASMARMKLKNTLRTVNGRHATPSGKATPLLVEDLEFIENDAATIREYMIMGMDVIVARCLSDLKNAGVEDAEES